jgi:hypothetical protein
MSAPLRWRAALGGSRRHAAATLHATSNRDSGIAKGRPPRERERTLAAMLDKVN